MGYRNYIGYLPRKEYQTIKSMSYRELVKYYKERDVDIDTIGLYDICNELYEFGKYAGFNPPEGSLIQFFDKPEVDIKFNEDREMKVADEGFLKYVIESYIERIRDYYKDMAEPFRVSKFMRTVRSGYTKDGDKFDTIFQADFRELNVKEQTAMIKAVKHVLSFVTEWEGEYGFLPFDLSKKDGVVSSSWKYEYGIFELVNIYKHFNWKKNVMIYYGY
jgi:hypothetical protein